nr:MAG TPA: hypothetical protein [Caudoviricetes sp.]
MLDKTPPICYNIITGNGKTAPKNKRPEYGRKRKNYD